MVNKQEQSIHKILLVLQYLLIHIRYLFYNFFLVVPVIGKGEDVFEGNDAFLHHCIVVAADLVEEDSQEAGKCAFVEEGWEVVGVGEEDLEVRVLDLDQLYCSDETVEEAAF